MSNNFKNKLENVASNSLYTSFTNSVTIEYSFEIFRQYIKSGRILELGPAEGLMTKYLVELDPALTVIEGSDIFANELRDKFEGISIVRSLFEEAEINRQFDNIILGHVLEHVVCPQTILKIVQKWLKKDGVILCAVPNARSLHRQVAVEAGLITDIFQMSEKDIHHGHQRIYTPETLSKEFIDAGFSIVKKGGYWLKPLKDSQLESICDDDLLRGFMKLGEFYPDIAGEIYVVAKLKS